MTLKLVEKMQQMKPWKTDEEIERYNRERKEIEKFEKEFNKEFNTITSKEILKPTQLELTGLPTDLCHTLIFHALPRRGRKALQANPVVKVFKTSWSKIEYEGRTLSTYDYQMLLALLKFARQNKSYEFIVSYPEIQEALGLKPNSKYNNQIRESLIRMSKSTFSIEGKKIDWELGPKQILTFDRYERKIKITFFESFYNKFLSNYTSLPLEFIVKLEGDLTKLLFTFLSSHRDPERYHVDTLIKILNMNQDLPKKRLTQQLKKAFNELKKKRVLTFKFVDDLFEIKIIPRSRQLKLI